MAVKRARKVPPAAPFNPFAVAAGASHSIAKATYRQPASSNYSNKLPYGYEMPQQTSTTELAPPKRPRRRIPASKI